MFLKKCQWKAEWQFVTLVSEMGGCSLARNDCSWPKNIDFRRKIICSKGETWTTVAYWKTLKTDTGTFWYGTFKAIKPRDYRTYDLLMVLIQEWELVSQKISKHCKVEGRVKHTKSLAYMGFRRWRNDWKPIDFVFLGSCTNGRIEDFKTFV
jgi:3-isopropylmalate/(R)-2-methylmalate dehydratase large subunit